MTTRPTKRNPGMGTDDAMRQDPRRTTHPLQRTRDTRRKNTRERKPANKPLAQTMTSPHTQIRTCDRGTNEYHTPTSVGIKSRLPKQRPTPTDTPHAQNRVQSTRPGRKISTTPALAGSKLKPPKRRPATRNPQLVPTTRPMVNHQAQPPVPHTCPSGDGTTHPPKWYHTPALVGYV
ncbi:hypothetical protein BS47DRAFT_1357791 [Hydnum rufescens UP504]|uniref:Uncharacterized protein n=1 Tax=Hydnum rufescens UP504 TaxID=1448309 RepID=A0A9P6B985_9AGAM|nr:hypothetical protein BS47DRAFT_1357791 [Hydnum rufescens UP504]